MEPKSFTLLGKIPESTHKASFTPQHGSPVVKATVKHLAEGFPTIKGDGRNQSFVSQYNNIFQGAWSRPAQPVTKHASSVSLGDIEKIMERETTHAASFRPPIVCSPPLVKERLTLKLGHFSKDLWSSTSRETFCNHKLGECFLCSCQDKPDLILECPLKDRIFTYNFNAENPVLLIRRNRNFSFIPEGDTDKGRNKERMSVTTNRISFSNLNPIELPVYVIGSDLMTKSHVRFSPPHRPGIYYTTTVSEHFSGKQGERPGPTIQVPSNILSGPELGVNISTTKADFLPLKTCTKRPSLSPQRSNIRFPLAHQPFTTTHSEDYVAKPLTMQRPGCSQFSTHFAMQ